MELTRITRENIKYFQTFLPEEPEEPTMIRLGMIEDETPCAAVVARIKEKDQEKSAEITWLFTAPEFRELGAAHDLIEELRDLVSGSGVKEIRASFFENNDGIEGFLKAEGFAVEDREWICAIRMSELEKLPGVQRLRALKYPERVDSLGKLLVKEKNLLKMFLYNTTGSGDYLEKSEDKLSVAAFEADKPVGVVITNVSGEEDLSIDLIYNTSSPSYMAGLLNQFVSAVEAANRMGNRIYFVAANDKIETFLQYLTGDAKSLLPSTLLRRGILAIS
ncbi:MAG: GNAT family N-acetyltransferase [Lachnospiraceae bacterium]|nr:GNAT family N-acetyltransferase [Lachnospiraceae bacterium]